MKKWKRAKFRLIKDVLFYAFLIVILIVFLFPIIWSVLVSFKEPLDIISLTPTFLYKPTLDNYIELFHATDIPFGRYFLNSVILSVFSTVLSLVIASLAGYSLARIKPHGSRIITLTVLLVRMLPPIAIIVPLYILYNKIGMIDSLIGLIIPYTALNIPLATWLLRSFFLDLPKELEEAAMIDGCSRLRAFFKIILPLAAPGLVATAIFSFELAWNDYILALPLTSVKAVPLTVVASMVRTEEGIVWGRLGAIITIMIIPVFLFTLLAQRYLVRGLVSGSVKE